MRNLVRETRLNPAQFVLPLFVCPGEGVKREISSMPNNYQMSIDEIVKECAEVEALGIGGVILFGLPETKDEMATGAYDENGIVQKAIRAIKRESSSMLVMTDVCNCEYTSHGHCGYVKNGDVDRLFVSACYAGQGPSMKRIRPAPMGRAFRVVKRTAHLTVAVAERPAKAVQPKKAEGKTKAKKAEKN